MNSNIMAYGDIHGCYKAAETAVILAEGLKARAVFLGDYVDRGPASMGVLEVLFNAHEKHPDWIFLRGNHDQMLLDLINGQRHPENFDERTEREAYAEWERSPSEIKNKVVDFLNTTMLFYETDQTIFVHAPLIETGRPINQKTTDELIWNYDLEPKWLRKRFIHGHKPTDEISFFGHGVNINTNCGYGGVLTGLLIKNNTVDDYYLFSVAEDGRVMD